MGYREDDKYVIYPIYFDSTISKNKGRRLPKSLSIEKPSIEDISKAAKSLNLKPILEKECSHPARHWKKEGRIFVDKKNSKNSTLIQIAKLL